MNASSSDNEDNGEETFLEESDIINEYDIDEEGRYVVRSSFCRSFFFAELAVAVKIVIS